MSLLEEIKKLRELEQQGDQSTLGWKMLDLAPAMLEVLGMIREGDASRLRVAAGNMEYSQPGPFTDHEIEMIKRLQQMAELMEQEAKRE